MLPTSARVDVLSPPPRRGVACASLRLALVRRPSVVGGQDSWDGTASGKPGR